MTNIVQIADLHIHSKYSRACSKELELPKIAKACEKKGIDIVATADFTHPLWFEHIKDCLEELNKGIYILKDKSSSTKFILSTEISCIYKHKDKTRRLHLVLLAPDLTAVENFNKELVDRGVNVNSDGRPIMGLSARQILEIILEIDPNFMMIPAHAWTPWFAIFGSKSGYDSLEECFDGLTPHIRAIETGLSSDPLMNRRLSQLDNITLVSNSDAHSLPNLGREANVFSFDNEKEITFLEIKRIIEEGDKKKFLYTIEFYPEEGMYYADGHRDCSICLLPSETKRNNYLCPECGKKLTVGVLHRVDDLADRTIDAIEWNNYIPHKYIVPLAEVISVVLKVGPKSKKVMNEYKNLLNKIGSEFHILLEADYEEIINNSNYPNIALAIQNMREQKIKANPGYDGCYGSIEVLGGSNSTQSELFK